MRGDFSRDTFDPLLHFSRVLVQQGRMQIDADSNEQSDILLHYLRTLAGDLIGGSAGPGIGFEIGKLAGVKQDFSIAPGRYYVNGVVCESDAANLSYATQAGYRKDGGDELAEGEHYIVYLDAWERMVTGLDQPSIHESALGEADTTTRAQVVWRVRAVSKPPGLPWPAYAGTDWRDWINKNGSPAQWYGEWPPTTRGFLKAMGKSAPLGEGSACVISPESRFRGLENQLYRVEIHHEGPAEKATFKWSRNNGSDVVALKSLAGNVATLATWGRGDREDFAPNDWVEIIEDSAALRGEPGLLAMVIVAQPDDFTLTLKPADGATLPSFLPADCVAKHVQLRRWDYRRGAGGTAGTTGNQPKPATDGALRIEEDKWLTLEDGVQVMFTKSSDAAYEYRSGDYWTIPARIATGDVEWPGPVDAPVPLPPRGIRHFYAPLAVIDVGAADVVVTSLRNTLKPIGM